MKIVTYGTRGSVPICNSQSSKYGGNTTSLRILSECLPPGVILAIDAGSGFVPLSQDVLREGGAKEVIVIFTHYHHDHTQGLFLSPLTFIPTISKTLAGPLEHEIGPEQMMKHLMRPPYFPVHVKEVASSFKFKDLEHPSTIVALFHPQAGHRTIGIDEYQRLLAKGENLPIGKYKCPVEECLVVTFYRSRHPEQTLSMRFEEKPTGKVFVFLTDHENEDGIPSAMKKHLHGVNLLIMDSQYSREKYDNCTAGYGHGTPDYCVKIAEAVGAERLGLTHSDPLASDQAIDDIVRAAISCSTTQLDIFACADYDVLEV